MALRVGLITSGTRGDVQPLLALSQELKARGHEVAICCPACSVSLVQEHGFEAFSMTYDLMQAIQGPEMQDAIDHGDGARCIQAINEAQQRQIKETGVDSADEVYEFVRKYLPDVLVGHPSFVPLVAVAEAFSLPLINALFMPFLPSRTVQPAWFTTAQLQDADLINKPLEAHKRVWDGYITEPILEHVNSLRARWGLLPYESVAHLHAVYQSTPEANCWSSQIFAEPPDMAQEFPLAKQVGYLFADAPRDYELPSRLVTFLQSGKKPVYVGFGSLCVGDPRIASEKVIRALRKAGQRCIMAGGWAGISPAHLDESKTFDFAALKKFADEHVFHVEAAPHDQLLPSCCGAVHHGGAGTVAAVARAGIPGAILPVAWDQPWWGEHLETQGVGINLGQMISKVDEDDLASAFTRLAEDQGLAERSAALAAAISKERPGRQCLADFVESCVHLPHPWATQAGARGARVLQPALWDRASPELSKSSDADEGRAATLGGA